MLLVTGGAGYVGSHAVRALRAAGEDVVVYDDLSEGHESATLGAPLVVADILDTDALERALRDHDVHGVMHFAARCYVGESMEQPERYWRINRDGTRSLLEAMRRVGVRHVIFSSTCAVYGEPDELPMHEELPRRPINVYGETKAAMEVDIEAEPELSYGIFRYFNAAGAAEDGSLCERHDPETHLIPLALAAARDGRAMTVFGDDYPTHDGTCLRDYVHVDDLADAHVLGMRHLLGGGAPFVSNLGYGSGISVLEVLQAAEAVTGRPVERTIGPRRPGDPAALYAAASRAGPLLGWAPTRTDIQTMVGHAWRAMQRHGLA